MREQNRVRKSSEREQRELTSDRCDRKTNARSERKKWCQWDSNIGWERERAKDREERNSNGRVKMACGNVLGMGIIDSGKKILN